MDNKEISQKELLKNFINNLKKAMKEKGYTQTKLADEGDINRTQLNKILNGKAIPTTSTIVKICDTLDIDLGYLYGAYKEDKSDIHIIKEITGLSAEASGILINLSNWNIEILNKFLINKRFKELINDIGDFCYPSTFLAKAEDDLSKQTLYGATVAEVIKHLTNTKNIHKFNASDRFNRILDDISEEYMNKEKKRYKANHNK